MVAREAERTKEEKKKGKGDRNLKKHVFTRAKAQRTACIVTPALVRRLRIWCSVMQSFSNYAHGMLFRLIAS